MTGTPPQWMSVSSPNALNHVYKLYCGSDNSSDIDKTPRDVFLNGTLNDIRLRFQVIDDQVMIV